MKIAESLEDFYKRKFDWLPENLKNEIGHFNLFPLEPYAEGNIKPLPYKRRDFYKIMLVEGDIEMHYADKVVEIRKPTLVFSNPHIPYKCEHLENITGGNYCIFNQHFFTQFGNLTQYSVFQPAGNRIFELNDEQHEIVRSVFAKMDEEINSEYAHKYDVLKNMVFELIHFALKMRPEAQVQNKPINASMRIAMLFMELLERQFPIDENHSNISLRFASDFAGQLNVHVNHLNRSLKEITTKTTSQAIAERVLQEAKIMLKNSNWNISEIAYSLGFTEVTHFNNFFKKHVETSPSKFRKLQ